ncbi:MAG TPA: YebC/PmpR family DNA-binding transcriptional regulator [Dissulfurispiraceae bacterium]|nr:YebC/PmpR family DNA-binding transcriptional regulator [Dissulfurispiraceae bacterium]
MSGHSKWSQIKHKKANTDAKKGKAFTKIVKEITVAARSGGDPDGNPRLRLAIEKAKEVNMPSDNIKKAVMKGTGELPGVTYEEIIYEGYGPGGAAILLDVLTDNKNRTVSEIRHLLSKHGGNLGEAGCVAWIFDKRGYILVEKTKVDEDTLMSVALDAGAEDLKNDPKEDNYEIITTPENLDAVRNAIMAKNIDVSLAEVTMLPKNYVPLEGGAAEQMIKLIDVLEDHEDIQNVYANFDVADETLNT